MFSDPFVASRVNRLELRLGDIKKVLGPGANTSESGSRIRRQLKHTIIRVFGGSKLPPITMSVTGLIKDIIKITNKLLNIRELCIDLWDLAPSDDLQPLFSSFWSSFGPKLSTLSLNGTLRKFRTLIKNSKLNGLHELCLELSGTADRAIVVDVLLPFINNLSPHLLSLRLWCRASLDLSTFFAQLAPFPTLKTLIIHTPFNKKAFGNTSGLEGLICNGSGTVQRVHLCLNPDGLTVDSEEPLSQWLLEYISNIKRLSYLLRILDMYPTDMFAGMEFLSDCIERTSQSLAKINVRDRYLQDGEIEAIINVASSYSNLVYLKMNIRKLDVVLTDHLALKLPQIDRLRLSIREYSVDDPQYLVVCVRPCIKIGISANYCFCLLEYIRPRFGHAVLFIPTRSCRTTPSGMVKESTVTVIVMFILEYLPAFSSSSGCIFLNLFSYDTFWLINVIPHAAPVRKSGTSALLGSCGRLLARASTNI